MTAPKRLVFAYFSPTGGTRRVMRRLLGAARACAPDLALAELDLTLPEDRFKLRRFSPSDVFFFAVPVYFGRMPKVLRDLKCLAGGGARAVPVAVYGNREFEDAAREAGMLLEGLGFTVCAGAAFVTRHINWPELGASRPDAADEAVMIRLIEGVLKKIEDAGEDDAKLAVKLPGEGALRPYGVIAKPPVASPESCCKCGSCAEKCPTGIIDPLSFTVTDPEECLGCRACMTACPNNARDFPEPVRSMMHERMAQIAAANQARKPAQIFL